MNKLAGPAAQRWKQLRLGNTSPWPLVAIGLALIGAGLGWDLQRQYHEAAIHERQHLESSAMLAAQAAVQRLAGVHNLLNRLDSALVANPTDAQAIVISISALETGVIAVLSVDDSGRVVASSQPAFLGVDLGPTELGYALRADADVEPRIHTVLPPESLGNSGHLLARARRGNAGAYAGASALLLAPDYFHAALATSDPDLAISLKDAAGNAVAVSSANTIATDALSASAEVSSTLVPLDRPWVTVAARSRAALWASWSRQARFGLLLWLGVALVAVLAGVVATLRRNELKKLRTLHRRLLQGADEGIVGVDLAGRVRFANPAFARACATTPGALLGRPLSEFLRWPAGTPGETSDPLASLLAGTGARHEGSCEIVGAPLPWRASISPTREGGQLVGALLSFVDPVATPDAGPTRGPAERLYRTLFELSPDGVLIVDLESERPLTFNSAAHRQLGYGADEFGRMRIREHEASPAPMDTIRHVARVVAEGRVEFETRYRHRDGAVRDVMVIAQTIDFAGRAALYWVVRDVTERKRATLELRSSEELTRTLIERLPLPLLVFEDERLTLTNARYVRELGAGAADLSAWLQHRCANRDATDAFLALWRALENTAHVQGELGLHDAAGVLRVFDLHLARIGTRTLVLLVDLSERRLAEQRLTEARALAERAQLARSEFLANMSHEIRTPMTTILGLGYLLQKSALDSAQRDQVQKIDHGARALLAILDDLLDYAKLETGRIRIDRQEFALRAVLDDIQVVFDAAARNKGLSYECEVRADVPKVLVGDPVRLRQVLLNLVGNAVKFTEHGQIGIEVSAEPPVDGQVAIIISVSDTGIGIETEKLAQIFEAFYQGETTASRRFGGTGLGLPISRWLVHLMGGDLTVRSTPDVGSTFVMRVPFTYGTPEDARTEPAASELPQSLPAPGLAQSRLAGIAVLLVEDHPINRQVAREILQSEGARVTAACDGQEAIDLLHSEPQAWQVVLMDLQMPTMDGFEATRRIRAMPGLGALPIIAMTANSSVDDRAQTRAAGMQDHLAKPVDVDTLVAAVRHYGLPAPLTPPAPAAPASNDETPVLALERALARLAGNRVLYAQMARMFIQEQADTIAHLHTRLDAGALQDAERSAHALKGVAATLGAERLAEVSGQLERALRKHAPAGDLAALIGRTETELAQANAALALAAQDLTPEVHHAIALDLFDRTAFRVHLDALVAALADDNMAAVDHYAALRALATEHLIEVLRPVEDALARLDFGTALEACRRAEEWLDRQGIDQGKIEA